MVDEPNPTVETDPPAPAPVRRRFPWPIGGTGPAVAVIGLVVTGALTWGAWRANDRSTFSLLEGQTRQAAATLSAVVPGIQTDLFDALTVARATNSSTIFDQFATSQSVATKRQFVSVSLWRHSATGTRMIGGIGGPPLLSRRGTAVRFLAGVPSTGTLSVTGILAGSPRRLGYAEAGPGPGTSTYVVYAESALPPPSGLRVPSTSPFATLNYAIYLGSSRQPSDLLAASVPTPIRRVHASVVVPFGDRTITVVATPRVRLAPVESAALPWIALGVGLGLTVIAAAGVEYLAHRRRAAEELSRRLDDLYAEQRTIARTLQHALLPERLPPVPGMDIAARYLPGARGTDVGGDWYDVVPLDGDRFVFIIGDVSGRGVRAAAVMAALRFASRGFALEGHDPGTILGQLARTLDIRTDEHFATVLCGLVDVPGHRVVLANAGHPPPVLRNGDHVAAIPVPPGPPIGVAAPDPVEPVVVSAGPGSVLVAYTDGLVERRGITLDDAVRRLEAAIPRDAASTGDLLDSMLAELMDDALEDDVAVIGLRWLT